MIKKRDEGIEASSGDVFEEIFLKAVNELDRVYLSGALEYGMKKFPTTLLEIKKAEDELNRLWQSGHKDQKTIREFKGLVNRWLLLNLRILDFYKGKSSGGRWKYDSKKGHRKSTSTLF